MLKNSLIAEAPGYAMNHKNAIILNADLIDRRALPIIVWDIQMKVTTRMDSRVGSATRFEIRISTDSLTVPDGLGFIHWAQASR